MVVFFSQFKLGLQTNQNYFKEKLIYGEHVNFNVYV